MKYFLTRYAPIFLLLHASGQHVQFSGNHSMEWSECIAAFADLDSKSEYAKLVTFGVTDGGKPLHLFVINQDKIFYPELFDRSKTIILVNNDIHAGEPDGVDASHLLCKELLDPSSPLAALLDSVIICIIPMYNVDGALLRGSYHRANQDGPAEYGFRANAKNLDLNRDFVKCDSRNARSFAKLFTGMKPHIFVDTHVSNGADYPYTMTLISTQPDKLGGPNGEFLRQKLEPALYAAMKAKGDEMCPYVNTMGRTPESGIAEFLETPRFSTGYVALFNTIGFTSETHMLKPFAGRVESTYRFLLSMLEYASAHCGEIIRVRRLADEEMQRKKSFALTYRLDTSQVSKFTFRGYEAETKDAAVGTGSRLYYDHNAGWERPIAFYNKYIPDVSATSPTFYIIPQAWQEVIERLTLNGVQLKEFKRDTTLTVQAYFIDDFTSPTKPYEGHFVHSDIKTSLRKMPITFSAGDYYVSTSQQARRFLAQTLEPASEDSYFAWNFFDAVLQQKEWFSDYVFEEKAAALLANDPQLRKDFDEAMQSDASLKDNHWNQLYWIYRRSPYFEQSANRYPVYRFDEKLP